MTVKIQPQYEALGIHPDTMTCVAIMPKSEAKEYVWSLATRGITATATPDRETKKGRGNWHVAVIGGLAYNPAAYFSSITGEDLSKQCMGTGDGQHPLLTEEAE